MHKVFPLSFRVSGETHQTHHSHYTFLSVKELETTNSSVYLGIIQNFFKMRKSIRKLEAEKSMVWLSPFIALGDKHGDVMKLNPLPLQIIKAT